MNERRRQDVPATGHTKAQSTPLSNGGPKTPVDAMADVDVATEEGLREDIAHRLAIIDEMRAKGIPVDAVKFEKSHDSAGARALQDGASVAIAGRIWTVREHGKLNFMTLNDQEGSIQISLKADTLGAERVAQCLRYHLTGDIVGIKGVKWTTKRGEPTIDVHEIFSLQKALRPPPSKWEGTNAETGYRNPDLKILCNPDHRRVLITRSRVFSALRRYMEDHGFLEIETPILQTNIGGAAAKPFVTHHNGLDMQVKLRIAPEIPLKRAMIGGMERVFEIGKDFRNEGMDASHLQEFTVIEWYAAYWTYEDNIAFTKDMITLMVKTATGGSLELSYQGKKIDFSRWERYDYTKLILDRLGIDIRANNTFDSLIKEVREKRLDLKGADRDAKSFPALVDALYKKLIRPSLGTQCPVILERYPVEMVPLARRNADDSSIAEKFQVLIDGMEVANSYTELVDPVEQRRRFEAQLTLRASGDEETMDLDEDFLRCLEYGLPPMSGVGIGLDRVMCILTDRPNLKDVIFFPLVGRAERR
ncbi:MAG: lysine--tRNA ligase [Oligoflexia bacterium]|nr:lysine--tRNA ligase [Oligoflexia bacterium]